MRERTEDRTEGEGKERPIQDRSGDVYARNDAAVRMESTRDRFGGVDVPATIIGALVAVALVAILGAVGGALLGTTVFGESAQLVRADMIPLAIVGAVVLAVAYFFGGWAAGRVARYNGTRNGVVAALLTMLLAVVGGAAGTMLGDRYERLAGIAGPNWLSSDQAVIGGAVSAVAAVVLMILFAALGGRRGEAYHRRADAYLTEPRYRGA